MLKNASIEEVIKFIPAADPIFSLHNFTEKHTMSVRFSSDEFREGTILLT
jgi:hypothetical protein